MKTTLEIPDELFRRTKALATLQGKPLRDVIVEALRAKVDAEPPGKISGWRAAFGRASLAATRDVDARIARAAERIDPADWR